MAKGPSAAEKNRFTLYGFAASPNTYTVALMLALCRHPFSYIHVSMRDGAHKQPDYLVKNRYGQVPALRDGQTYYVQSAAILLHISEALGKFDGKTIIGAGPHSRVAVLAMGQAGLARVPSARPKQGYSPVRR